MSRGLGLLLSRVLCGLGLHDWSKPRLRRFSARRNQYEKNWAYCLRCDDETYEVDVITVARAE